jgi:hypothetical protein
MEDVGLFEVVELFLGSDKCTCRKAAVGQVIEKDVIGYQFYYGDYSPSRDLFEPVRKSFHVGNAGGRKLQCVDGLKKRSAGTTG